MKLLAVQCTRLWLQASRTIHIVLFVLPDSAFPFPVIGSVSMEKVHYCERFIELMIDLEVRWLLWRQAEGDVGEALLMLLL